MLLFGAGRLLVRGAARALSRSERGERLGQVVRTVGGLLVTAAFALLALAAIGGNLLLLSTGEGVAGGTLARLNALPPGFWVWLGLALAQCLGLAVVAALLIAIIRRLLARAGRRAVASARITAADADIAAFFAQLNSLIANSLRLTVLGLGAGWLGLPGFAAFVSIALRIYLLVAFGALIIQAVTTLVDSLDALSERFAGPDSRFGAYSSIRSLVPLLRRCLELVIWLGVTSLGLLQIAPVASLAVYGPRLIEVVAIAFLARVGAELASLFVDRGDGGGAELTELERQQRATLFPLLKSALRGAVYFVALVLILNALDFNPLPLLAGAGVVGVVVGLGAQAVITDLVSGLFILVESQFLVGDYVEAGSARGVVEAIQLRTTRIRDPNGQQHIVRNGQITGVVNHSKAYTFAVIEFEVPYDADLERVYTTLNAVGARFAAEHPDVLETMAIKGVEHFSKSGLVLRTTTKVRPGSHGQVSRDLRQAVLQSLREAGIRISG